MDYFCFDLVIHFHIQGHLHFLQFRVHLLWGLYLSTPKRMDKTLWSHLDSGERRPLSSVWIIMDINPQLCEEHIDGHISLHQLRIHHLSETVGFPRLPKWFGLNTWLHGYFKNSAIAPKKNPTVFGSLV